jgi:hypothetical protein
LFLFKYILVLHGAGAEALIGSILWLMYEQIVAEGSKVVYESANIDLNPKLLLALAACARTLPCALNDWTHWAMCRCAVCLCTCTFENIVRYGKQIHLVLECDAYVSLFWSVTDV